jgi:transcriptional regulator with XRE-family HTH domain
MTMDILASVATCVKLGKVTIPHLLRSHFERTGEAQAAFARRIGVTPQTVSQLVRGDIKVPTADVRRRLAREFNLRHVDLLVMAGELAEDEVEPRTEAFSYDSDRAALIALIEHELTEADARVLAVTARAIIEERDARTVSDAERYAAGTLSPDLNQPGPQPVPSS